MFAHSLYSNYASITSVFLTTGSSVPLASDLPSNSCSGLNKTVYVYPYQKVAKVKLPNGAIVNLPAGVFKFQWPYKTEVCAFFVTVLGKFVAALLLLNTNSHFLTL